MAAKLLCALVAGYALSPIDLIPDFIPVLGYIDDLLLVPAGIWLAIALIRPAVMADLRFQADRQSQLPVSAVAAIVIVLVWLVGAVLVFLVLRSRLIG